jgi:hypothetical protein
MNETVNGTTEETTHSGVRGQSELKEFENAKKKMNEIRVRVAQKRDALVDEVRRLNAILDETSPSPARTVHTATATPEMVPSEEKTARVAQPKKTRGKKTREPVTDPFNEKSLRARFVKVCEAQRGAAKELAEHLDMSQQIVSGWKRGVVSWNTARCQERLEVVGLWLDEHETVEN